MPTIEMKEEIPPVVLKGLMVALEVVGLVEETLMFPVRVMALASKLMLSDE